jgi:hypothetical protein
MEIQKENEREVRVFDPEGRRRRTRNCVFVRRSTWIESTGMIPSITTSAAYRKRCLRSRNTVGCMAHYCRTQGGVQCLAAAPRLSRSVVILTRGREVSIRQSRDAFGPTFCPDRIRTDDDRIGIVDFPGPCPCPCRPSRQKNLGTAKQLRELYFLCPCPSCRAHLRALARYTDHVSPYSHLCLRHDHYRRHLQRVYNCSY